MPAEVIAKTAGMPNADWLELRRQGIGGSDAAVVCGLSRYKSVVELWMEKTGQMLEQPAGEPAYWGTRLEPLVRDEFTARTGIEVTHKMELLRSEEHPFMLANLDGICTVPDIGTCIFEAKTASAYKTSEWADSIPDEYLLQVQHYMAVTGFAGTYIAVLIGGNNFRWQFVERDDEVISMLIALESDFWQHVESGSPPPIDGTEATAQLLAQKFPTSKPKSCVELPEEAQTLLEAYDEICENLNAATEEKRKVENRIKEMMGDNETGTVANRIVSWKTISQERLDSKTLKAEHPKLYKKYSNLVSYRRFTVKTA